LKKTCFYVFYLQINVFNIYARNSDGATCLEVGVHEHPDLPEAFHERRMHEFANLD